MTNGSIERMFDKAAIKAVNANSFACLKVQASLVLRNAIFVTLWL